MDFRSSNAPSGITDMSLPCRDLVQIGISNDLNWLFTAGAILVSVL